MRHGCEGGPGRRGSLCANPIATGAFCLLGACVLARRGAGALRVLDWGPLALAGVVSYSIYVWHMPIVAWLAHRTGWSYLPLLLLGLLIVLPIAAISYRLVERPFLALRRRWSPAAVAEPTRLSRA